MIVQCTIILTLSYALVTRKKAHQLLEIFRTCILLLIKLFLIIKTSWTYKSNDTDIIKIIFIILFQHSESNRILCI